MTPDETNQTRQLIRRADPTSRLAPLSDNHIFRLTRAAMNSQTNTPLGSAATAHSRRPRLIAAGAAALAAAAAAVAVPMTIGSSTPALQLAQAPSGGPAAMCAEVTPGIIASADTAIRAQVIAIDGTTVTLRTIDQLIGDKTDTIATTQGNGTPVDGGGLVFTKGTTYLIAANDDTIINCGVSGPETPALDKIYKAATG